MVQNMIALLFAKRPPLFFTTTLFVMSPLGVQLVPIAQAATFTVNSTIDAVDATPGDGRCATAVGDCTLRAAIQEANALGGDNIILVPAGTYTLSRNGPQEDAGATGDLDINSNLSIVGAGMANTVISGSSMGSSIFNFIFDRVFSIAGGVIVSISGVTVQNGSQDCCSGGGGILNGGTLTLDGIKVSGNTGSGITNAFGSVTLNNSIVSSNTSNFFAGGIDNFQGTVTLNNSTVSDNTNAGIKNDSGTVTLNQTIVSGNGAGISNSGGTVTLNHSTLDGNGGGINNFMGTVTINNSTVSRNGRGGGINNASGGGIIGTVTLNNSTVSSNTAEFSGGGIFNSGSLALSNSTVTSNTATSVASSGGGIYNQINLGFTSLTLGNSIVAGNRASTGPDCWGDSSPSSIISAGYNLIGNTSGCPLTPGVGDLSNVGPLLGPLQDNGGPTFTHALLAGSPAIDAGSPNCPPPDTDQRGIARPQGPACDIGSYESASTAVTPRILAPADGAALSLAGPTTFSWAAVPGAQAYLFEFTGPDLTFTNPRGAAPDPVNGVPPRGGAFTVTGTSVSLVINPAAFPGLYRFRIAALGASGRFIGTFSDARSVVIPPVLPAESGSGGGEGFDR